MRQGLVRTGSTEVVFQVCADQVWERTDVDVRSSEIAQLKGKNSTIFELSIYTHLLQEEKLF